MCMRGDFFFLLHVYMHTMCMPGACTGQKRVLGPLEVESWRLGVIKWVLEKKTCVSERAVSAINY